MLVVNDLGDKSYECLNPKIAAWNNTARTVENETFENMDSNRLSEKPLS